VPATTKNPLDYANLNLDDSRERHAFYDAWIAKGSARIVSELRRMIELGIIDEQGNLLRTDTPPDMLDPDSSVEQ
jgi:hypothetical protein